MTHRHRRLLPFLLIGMTACYLPRLGLAQVASTAAADSLFQAHEWPKAEAAYHDLTQQDATNGQAWLRLGYARYMQEKFEGAADAWKAAGAAGFAPATAYYNAASAYARLDRNDEALDMLSQAAEAGFQQVDQMENDPDFAALKDDPRFADVRTAIDKNARPCYYDDRYRQFDFWAGDWDVYNAQGQKAGTSHVERILEDCVLQENWTGARGGAGKSFNFFDPASGKWKQVWVNPFGGNTLYEGAFSDGAMRFEGTVVSADGSTKPARMTFTPLDDGRVRQFIEQSNDGGATWTAGFEGFYQKVEKTEGD